MDPSARNYDRTANKDDDSCVYTYPGCTLPGALNYNPRANQNDGSCILEVCGCTDSAATNYDPSANKDDGTCTYRVPGCTSRSAMNFNIRATHDDGSCIVKVPGCTDSSASNYDSAANFNDGSCIRCPAPRAESGPVASYDTCLTDSSKLATIWSSYIGDHSAFSTNSYSLARGEMNDLHHTGEQMDTLVLSLTTMKREADDALSRARRYKSDLESLVIPSGCGVPPVMPPIMPPSAPPCHHC
jgi:hypothetical protein